jgi:hypothetical protein
MKTKPAVVMSYNGTINGVDDVDQHLPTYTVLRKLGKKYYREVFFHILKLILWNSYVLQSKTRGKKTPLHCNTDWLSHRSLRNMHYRSLLIRQDILERLPVHFA